MPPSALDQLSKYLIQTLLNKVNLHIYDCWIGECFCIQNVPWLTPNPGYAYPEMVNGSGDGTRNVFLKIIFYVAECNLGKVNLETSLPAVYHVGHPTHLQCLLALLFSWTIAVQLQLLLPALFAALPCHVSLDSSVRPMQSSQSRHGAFCDAFRAFSCSVCSLVRESRLLPCHVLLGTHGRCTMAHFGCYNPWSKFISNILLCAARTHVMSNIIVIRWTA